MAQFIAFLLIGALGGFLGALFNWINVKLCNWRINYLHKQKLYRFIEVILGAIITTSFVMVVPYYFGSCKENNETICDTDDS